MKLKLIFCFYINYLLSLSKRKNDIISITLLRTSDYENKHQWSSSVTILFHDQIEFHKSANVYYLNLIIIGPIV